MKHFATTIDAIANKLKALGLMALVAVAVVLPMAPAQAAQDMSGFHAFFEDDRNQFVDAWLNDSGTITMKVSNGRPWRPMHVVVHVTFFSGGVIIGKQDYRVSCVAPLGGGGGKEEWYTFPPAPIVGATSISITTNKVSPRERGPRDWRPPLPSNGR